ncbi:MAG TPA: hypothetical protein VLA03_08070 [Draconibacterium sp.]|nr:hypothetical protein [Draconibacterium sp.]
MDKNLLGIAMILIGLFFSISGFRKSEFVIYQILVSKSRKMWGEKVHKLYQIAGLLIIVVGILVTMEVV